MTVAVGMWSTLKVKSMLLPIIVYQLVGVTIALLCNQRPISSLWFDRSFVFGIGCSFSLNKFFRYEVRCHLFMSCIVV